MSEPIKVGDLVYIKIWPCCGSGAGRIATVKGIVLSSPTGTRCSACGASISTTQQTLVSLGTCRPHIEWVRRIPPLDEMEGERQKEDLREPA
jgi:hypothetical protein